MTIATRPTSASPTRPLNGEADRWLAVARWPILLAVTTLALFVAASTAFWQFRSTFAIPFGDQWSAVYEYFQFQAGQIGVLDLFRQSNEHRIFFPRLIMFADLRWFGGRNAFNVVMSDVFQIAHLALLLWIGRSILVRSFAGWVTAAFIVAAMLTGSQYENIYWGFQSCFVMVFLFASAALAAAARLPPAGGTRLASMMVLAAAIVCAAVSTFSMANGLFVWPILLLAVLDRRAGPLAVAVVAATGAAITAFYLRGYVSVGAHTPLSAALYSPLDAAGYFLAYLGAVIAPRSPWAAGAWGAVLVLVLAILAARRLIRHQRFDAPSLFFWGLVLFLLLSAAATTLGRFKFGSIQALSPRYITPDAALWSAAAILVLDAFRSRAAQGACCAAAALLTMWLALVDQPLSFERMADHETEMAVASDAVVAGVTDAATLAALRATPEAVVHLSALLKPQRLSVFGSREAGWMGKPVDEAFAVVEDPSCLGSIDSVQPFGPNGSDGAAVAGWAWDGTGRHGPAEVVFTNGGGTIVGFARGQWARPDVPATIPDIGSDRVGWEGFLSPVRGSEPRAYSVSDDDRTVCRFGQ